MIELLLFDFWGVSWNLVWVKIHIRQNEIVKRFEASLYSIYIYISLYY